MMYTLNDDKMTVSAEDDNKVVEERIRNQLFSSVVWF